MSRRSAIRLKCLDCSSGYRSELTSCQHDDCPLYRFRTGNGKQNPKERNEAIKVYCQWCMYDNSGDISNCPALDCPLYEYRGYLLKKGHIGATLEAITTEDI